MTGAKRHGVAALLDWIAVAATYIAAVAVRTGGPEVFDPRIVPLYVTLAFVAGFIQVLSNALFDVYWRDWSAAALEDMVAVLKAALLVVVALLSFNLATDVHWMPTGAVLAGGSLSVVVEIALHLR